MKKILLLFILLSNLLIAQNKEVKPDLSSPYGTIYTHLYFLQPNSYQPEKAALTIYGLKELNAEKKAIKLKKILDGKGLFVIIGIIQHKQYLKLTNFIAMYILGVLHF